MELLDTDMQVTIIMELKERILNFSQKNFSLWGESSVSSKDKIIVFKDVANRLNRNLNPAKK